MAPSLNPTNETLSPDVGGDESNKSGPNPSGNAREQTLLTIANVSVVASGNPNDTSVLMKPHSPHQKVITSPTQNPNLTSWKQQ